jgi:pyruvate/2-oxoacid:ferredoxin oxidoreductase beta subunit
MSSRVKDLSAAIGEAMDYPGFAVVHVQSPCTTYNDTYALLKGDEKQGIEPLAFPIPDSHDSGDLLAAINLVRGDRIPIGQIFRRDTDSVPSHERLSRAKEQSGVTQASVKELMDGMLIS